MLYYETITPKSLGLLKKIQNIEGFEKLRLVGGTSLGLQLGHRKSIDLDLFGDLEIDNISIVDKLNKIGDVKIMQQSPCISIFIINNIKVDIVKYKYQWLSNSINENGIEIADIKDIAAMKLSAITGRGTKKDFIDLYFLLKQYTLEELIAFFQEKYHDGTVMLVLRSLTYFEDADDEAMPIMCKHIKWEEIKEYIRKELNKYLKTNI